MIRFIFALMAAGVLLAAGPSRAAPPLEAYGKLPATRLVTLSPSGQRYAYIDDNGQSRRLIVAAPGGKALVVPLDGNFNVQGLIWAGDDYILVHISKTVNTSPEYTVDKSKNSKYIIVNIDKKIISYVYQDRKFVDNPVYGYYGTAKIDGRWYGYFGGKTLEAVNDNAGSKRYANTSDDGSVIIINSDLYRVDLETGDVKIVATGSPDSDDWLVDSKGEIVARLLYNETNGVWRIKSGGFGGRDLASGRSALGAVDLMGLGRSAGSVLIKHQGDKGPIIEEVPLDGGPAKLVSDALLLDYPLQDRQTGQWIGTITYGDEPSYALFSAAFDARVRAARKAFPGYRTELKDWSADFNRMVIYTDGGDDSGTYWLIDIAKQSAGPLRGDYPTIGPNDVGPVKMIDYKAADGLALRGVLTLPPGRLAKNLPLVVMPHGGPESRDYPQFDWWAQAFASRGYAVFQPNFRGSDGYGSKFVEAGYGQWGRKMQTDISDGVAELARQGVIDPKRACIVGASYGGYAALAGVTVQQGLYRCAVSVAGVADPERMLYSVRKAEGGEANAATRFWKTFLGVDASGWEGLKTISPVNLAARADAPILLIHGKDDTTVSIDQSDLMEAALTHAGKPVERLTLEGTDHYLLLEKTRIATVKASVEFVEKYNPPDPEPTQTAH